MAWALITIIGLGFGFAFYRLGQRLYWRWRLRRVTRRIAAQEERLHQLDAEILALQRFVKEQESLHLS